MRGSCGDALILVRKLVDLIAAENRTVLADVLGSDVASSAFADAAFHAKLHGGVDLGLFKAQLLQASQSELDHNGRTAQNGDLVGGEAQLLDVVRYKAHVTVPFGLFTVDGEMHVDIGILRPFADDLVIIDQILHTAGAVYNVDFAVTLPVVTAIVDYGTKGRQTDTAGNKQQILALQAIVAVFRCRNSFYREVLSQRASDSDFLSYIHHMQPACQTAALFNGKIQEIRLRGGGSNGKQGLPYPRNGQHGALAGDMDEGLFAVKADNTERLDVRRIHLGITPKADAKQKIEAALTDEIEMKLDEADKAAAADSVRYTEDEVFSRRDLRKQI